MEYVVFAFGNWDGGEPTLNRNSAGSFGFEGSGVMTWTNENGGNYLGRNVIGGDSWRYSRGKRECK